MRLDALQKHAQEQGDKFEAKRAVDMDYARGVLARARVDAQHLVDSPVWNAYLEMIEAINENDCRRLEGLQAVLEDPGYRTAEECQKTQFDCAILIARIQARNECIEIPKRIQGAAAATRA